MHRWTVFHVVVLAVLVLASAAGANTTPQTLPFSQSWTDIGLIATDDDWNGVAGVVGYRGDGLAGAPGVDPQTVVGEGTPVVDVNANEATPDTNNSGGVAEFELADPVVALQGSGTADAPHVVLYLDTTGKTGVSVSYKLRDLDGSADDSVQQVALQFRTGSTGDFTNVPAGFVADATSAGTATQTTSVSATLPAEANDKAQVQVRIITTNAVGNDEWVGVDDIQVGTAPTGVTVQSFSATRARAGVLLRWRTAPGWAPLGFDVYREAAGGRLVRVSRSLIASGLVPAGGRLHSIVAPAAPRGTLYRLQAVGPDGRRAWHASARLR
ncbi:MAG: hypothetical protein ABR521_05690 [Gaiellaceae bacterium]